MGIGLAGMGRRTPLSPKKAKVVSFLTAGIFIVVGAITIVTAEAAAASVSPIPGGRIATGTIESYQTGSNCGRYGCTSWWQPTIQFTTASGTPVTFTGPHDQNPLQTGETVNVSYNPSNPTDAHDISANVGSTTTAVVFGALFAAVAVVLVLAGHRRIAGSYSLHAAHTAASTTTDGLTTGPEQTEASTSATGPPGAWVGHRYVHSRTSLVITGLVFVGLAIWLIFAV
jgi:Protein of unknown function (DUF3592)